MTQCWHEGELRAYLDRELSPGDMERAAAHIEECGACGRRYAEIAARAARVTASLQALGQPETPETLVTMPAMPRRAAVSGRWMAAAGALAATVAIALVLTPKHPQRQDAVVATPPPPARTAPAPAPAAPPPATVKPAIIRRAVPKKPKPQVEYYVALDDEPIETGVVVRVGLDNGLVPADVIFGTDGRARAIRLVNDTSGEK
jgi:anti-sigma factor RsiW